MPKPPYFALVLAFAAAAVNARSGFQPCPNNVRMLIAELSGRNGARFWLKYVPETPPPPIDPGPLALASLPISAVFIAVFLLVAG